MGHRRALGQLRKVSVPPSELKGVDGLPPHVVPVLLTSLYATLKVPHDFRQAVEPHPALRRRGRRGRRLTGALLGAHLGTAALPARLRKNVLYADTLVDTADRLFQARQVRETLATALAHAPPPLPLRSGVSRSGQAGGLPASAAGLPPDSPPLPPSAEESGTHLGPPGAPVRDASGGSVVELESERLERRQLESLSTAELIRHAIEEARLLAKGRGAARQEGVCRRK